MPAAYDCSARSKVAGLMIALATSRTDTADQSAAIGTDELCESVSVLEADSP
jgi:hypothetical protein